MPALADAEDHERLSDKNTTREALGQEAAGLVVAPHERGTPVFRLADVEALAGLSPASARSFARTLVDRGVAARLASPGHHCERRTDHLLSRVLDVRAARSR